MRRFTFLRAAGAALTIAIAIATSPAAPAAPAAEVVRVTGTGTALGAMRRLGAAYERAHPGVEVRVLPSVGSSGAVKAVLDGAIDVALTGRPPRPEERSLPLAALPYARTPFVLAAGKRVGVPGITADEAVRIYRGELTTWPNGERVRVVLRPRTDVDTALLAALSPEMAAAMDLALAREGMLMAATNQDCDELLVQTPGSIGPSSLTQILTEDPALTPLAWNGVAPTLANLASGRYPLGKTLYAVVRTPPSPSVRRFLAFLGSPEARSLLEQTGNLPVPLPSLD